MSQLLLPVTIQFAWVADWFVHVTVPEATVKVSLFLPWRLFAYPVSPPLKLTFENLTQVGEARLAVCTGEVQSTFPRRSLKLSVQLGVAVVLTLTRNVLICDVFPSLIFTVTA